ncbi:MAG TPA: universal stress protein [Candidatus Baltobacteraceae bacterium]|jgi:nucleotide-binding universal stress UspA family protein|nr:universal stress protein [Candidatus Baltobacteraceae bacterium]
MSGLQMTSAGIISALLTVIAVCATLWWMMHPPKTKADIAAKKAERALREQLRTVVVAFSSEIQSEHMMALAARLARGENSEVLVIYVIEVPFTLPTNAVMEEEDRIALDALASAEAIGKSNGVEVRTEVVHHRQTAQAVLDIAKRERADLIIMGSYREGKYTGAPLGRDIEQISANAKCDVLIGVEGKHGTLLVDTAAQASGDGEVMEKQA